MGNKPPAAFKLVHALNSELIRPRIRPIGWATRPLALTLMYSNSGTHLLTIHDAAKLCRSSDWCIINTNLSEGQEESSCTCARTDTHTPTQAVAAVALKVFSFSAWFKSALKAEQRRRINNEAKMIFHFNDLLLSLKNHFLKCFQGWGGPREEPANLK